MNRRGVLALYLAARNVAIVGVLYLALYAAMSGGFGELERSDAEENLQRLQQAIGTEFDRLAGIAGDWGPWSDTYEFVRGRSDTYVASNLVPSVLTNFDLDFMLFLGTDGLLVYSFVADDVSVHTELVRHLEVREDLLRHEHEGAVRSGLVSLNGTSLLVASAPIVRSDLSGPIVGTLLVGRTLDRARLDRLEDRTLLSLDLQPPGAPAPTPGEADWASAGADAAGILVPVSRDRMDGYLPVADVYGDPAVVVRASLPRPVAAQGREVAVMVAAILVLVGLTVGVVEYVLMSKLIASRRALHEANEDLERRVRERTDELERLNVKLHHDAFHDALTGLPNRALFRERLNHAFELRNRRDRKGLAVIFLDLDRFKVINDRMGHTVGDELLVEVANRLRATVRASDTIARLGGDEFTILLEEVEDVDAALETVARVQERMEEPFVLQGRAVDVSLSAGIVMADDAYVRPDDLLRDADIAMYRAKRVGKANTRVFTPEGRARTLDQMER